MIRPFRSFVSFFLSSLLMTTPAFARAEVSAPKDLQALSAQEKVQDVYDLLRPVRKGETISETYYRLSVRLDDEEQAFLSGKIGKEGLQKSPKVSVKNQTLILADQGKEIRITYVENKKDGISILVNGKALTQAEIDSPALRWNRLEQVLKEQGLKAHHDFPLIRLFLPEVHAFSWWMLLGIGGAALAAFIMYKKNKKASQTKCSDSTPSCCLVNGAYVPHTNACCQEFPGGAGIGSGAVCPSTTPAAVPLSVPTNSSGQQ
ncbi:MAG TPA: hypothetical protein PL182_11705 [Pseudobdellovibrionaceae bacterium]|nr:hypothetical protein [Pseudobdellovibrionaceae bacterium]